MKRFYASECGAPEPWEAQHTQIVRDITARGMVLLENRNALPLQENCRVALYGYGARNTAYCGYGAASINSRVYTNIEQGLEQSGITVTSKEYLDRYDAAMAEEEEAYFRDIRSIGGSLFDRLVKMYSVQFTPVCQLPITEQDVAMSATETAIFVITRVSGEGADRKAEPGDYSLSQAEKDNLQFLSDHYSKVIVVLNTVGPIDTDFLRNLPNLGAILFAGLNGGVTGEAVADVLTGKVVPEGKLTTTWAERYKDYPNADTFSLVDGDVDDEYYSEGIYVGYRYFDSFGITPVYPFGYGLSYTQFDIAVESVSMEKNQARLAVRVTNRGEQYAGREVVQLYASCPAGKLDQPAQRLVAFQKTDLLQPGAAQTVILTVSLEELSSFCEEDGAWLLEQGDYILRVGNSSRNTVPAAVLRLQEQIILERCRPFVNQCGDMESWKADPAQSIYYGEILPRELPVLHLTGPVTTRTHSYDIRQKQTQIFTDKYFLERCEGKAYTFPQLLRGECTAREFVAALNEQQLTALCVGGAADSRDEGTGGGDMVCASDDTGMDVNGEVPLEVVVGASYGTAALLESHQLPNVSMADGGCGIRLLPEYEMDENGRLLTAGISAIKNGQRLMNEAELAALAAAPKGKRCWQYTTALPMSSVLAQTWDPAYWRSCGDLERREMKRFGLKVWLGPGMNIHRNPLCGRNFEYFSEDPLITGLCAAHIIDGIQEGGHTAATIKHVACNNQEENRGGMNALVSERALREIYLKCYEIAVRQSKPMCLMTGHNLVNGVNAAESYDILTSAAREEWGFDGLVMTDWGTTTKHEQKEKRKYGASDCDTCIVAGTDLFMPGSAGDLQELRTALKNGTLPTEDLRWCAMNVIEVFKKLWEQ